MRQTQLTLTALIVFIMAFSGALNAAKEKTFQPPEKPAILLQPGDLLGITIYNNPDLSRTNVPVAPDGRIYFLMIEPVMAAGRETEKVAKDLEDKLNKFIQFSQIDLTIKQQPRNQFTILGQIGRPGLYDITPGLSLKDAIATAGGINGKQSIDNTNIDFNGAFLLRKNGKSITLNLEELLAKGDSMQQLYIEPGDYLYLAELADKKVYLLGQIDQPQAISYRNDLTLLKALASLSKTTFDKTKPYLENIVILRGTQSNPQIIKVEMAPILEGKAKDIKLLPQDIIYIPEKQIDWAEIGDIAFKAYTGAFATKTALYTFDTIKALAGVK